MIPEHCRDKLKTDLIPPLNAKITRRVIRKHPKTVAHAFTLKKNRTKKYKLLMDSLGTMFTPYQRLTQIQDGAPPTNQRSVIP